MSTPAATITTITTTTITTTTTTTKTNTSKKKKKRPSKTKKLPVTASSTPTTTLPSTYTQALISRYHTLNKEKAKALAENDNARATELEKEQKELGGLATYQKASLTGQSKHRGGDSSKWLLKELKTLGIAESLKKPIRLLEVGALSSQNYASEASWIDVTPIDLHNSHDPKVTQADFFTYPVPVNESQRYDILSLSLVVNFVGDPVDRGTMLARTRHFLRKPLSPSQGIGYLFLVLPLPCINNSRYMTDDHLKAITESLGFRQVSSHFSRKLAFYLLRYDDDSTEASDCVAKKSEIGKKRKGEYLDKGDVKNQKSEYQFPKKRQVDDRGGLNNFSIIL